MMLTQTMKRLKRSRRNWKRSNPKKKQKQQLHSISGGDLKGIRILIDCGFFKPFSYRLIGEKKVDPNEDLNKKLLKAARILERMVNQNTYNDIALGDIF